MQLKPLKKKKYIMGVRHTALQRLMPAVTTNGSVRQCEAYQTWLLLLLTRAIHSCLEACGKRFFRVRKGRDSAHQRALVYIRRIKSARTPRNVGVVYT